jgi:hypothetical protein
MIPAAMPKTAVAGFFATLSGLLLFHDILSPSVLTMTSTKITSAPVNGISARLMPAPAPDLNLYATISARPVFLQSRRPPPVLAAQTMWAGPPPVTFSLIGVVDAPEQKFGLVLEPGATTAIPVHRGSVIDGWTVSILNNASILIRAGNNSELIKIAQ